jgi:hypothetical protein
VINVDIAKDYERATNNPGNLLWFAIVSRPGGPWDFKRFYPSDPHRTMENFGNWHFGMTAQGAGIPLGLALSGAGMVQEGSKGQGIPFLQYPYGEDPYDVPQVEAGYKFGTWMGCVSAVNRARTAQGAQ